MQPLDGPFYSEGWYPDPYSSSGQLRWFDGTDWTEHTTVVPAPTTRPANQALANQASTQINSKSVAVAQADATTVLTIVQHSPNHLFHFVMTVCTGGVWLPVWIAVTLWPRKSKVTTRTVNSSSPRIH